MRFRLTLLLLACCSAPLHAQQGVFTHNSVLRSDHSSSSDSLAHPLVGDRVTLLSPTAQGGYYHVQLADGKQGWAWRNNISVTAVIPPNDLIPIGEIDLSNGTPGTAATVGCGDGLWQHVYHPSRLLVFHQCITISGVIMDATAHQSHHRADGARHEADGDTHGWLKLDAPYVSLLNAGNNSDEEGFLVFEIVCHYPVTQASAKPACTGFHDTTVIPPVGTHVYLTGSFVQDDNHAHWNEIHPVTRLVVR